MALLGGQHWPVGVDAALCSVLPVLTAYPTILQHSPPGPAKLHFLGRRWCAARLQSARDLAAGRYSALAGTVTQLLQCTQPAPHAPHTSQGGGATRGRQGRTVPHRPGTSAHFLATAPRRYSPPQSIHTFPPRIRPASNLQRSSFLAQTGRLGVTLSTTLLSFSKVC